MMTLVSDLRRGQLIAAVYILGFANGITIRIREAVARDGVAIATFATFEISIAVWAAFIASPYLLLTRPSGDRITRTDWGVLSLALGAIMLPVPDLSWIALTLIAIYLLVASGQTQEERQSPIRCSAWILLATTGAMFWGRQLIVAASWPILDADAFLVSWFAGGDRVGNAVWAAGHQEFIWVGPPCSSLANLSLAMLCWVMFAQIHEHRWSRQSMACAVLACLSVVGINVTRMGLMARYPEDFDFIHGPIGSSLASWCSVALVLAVCLFATRNARRAAS